MVVIGLDHLAALVVRGYLYMWKREAADYMRSDAVTRLTEGKSHRALFGT